MVLRRDVVLDEVDAFTFLLNALVFWRLDAGTQTLCHDRLLGHLVHPFDTFGQNLRICIIAYDAIVSLSITLEWYDPEVDLRK